MSTSRDDFQIAVRSALLQRGAKEKFSILFLICFAAAFFFLDSYKFNFINTIRSIINDGIYRVSTVANTPNTFFSKVSNSVSNLIFLKNENINLNNEIKKLKNKDFQVEFLTNENKILRRALQTSNIIMVEHRVAKVILDRQSPYLHSIIINRGTNSGIAKGMPVVDGKFLIGSIVEVNFLSSRVLLLNDLNSRIPVTFGSEGIQAILSGKGGKNPKLEYLPEVFEKKEDITIFTSGKDGIFKPGIPVGKTQVDNNEIRVKLFSDTSQLSFVSVQLVDQKIANF